MAPKRKVNSKTASNKKAKVEEHLSIENIEEIGETIVEKSSYNDITKLLDQYQLIKKILIKEENTEIESLGRQLSISLFQVFTKLIKKGLTTIRKADDEKRIILVKWIINKYDDFKENLCWFITNKLSYKSSLQLDCLDILLKLIKIESSNNVNDKYFPLITYRKLVEGLLLSQNGEIVNDTSDNFIILEFMESFQKHYDLQFYFFQDLSKFLDDNKDSKDLIFSNFYLIIKSPLLLIGNDDASELSTYVKNPPSAISKTSTFKHNYQQSINSILSYDLSINQYKTILSIMNKRILPLLSKPSNLMDFLTDCYNLNSNLIIQILSLNSLYELMKTYNLEYPDFYKKLYSLLTPELLINRYRSRFFRLCDLFLTSTHLSANLVASFIKKLAKLSIASSASGTIIVIPFIYNLLKRHPSCMIMIHNTEVSNDYQDPYNDEEEDPLKTQAIHSSLWELEALMNHYHPNISTLSAIFKEPFRKPNYNLEDFLDWSYKSLLDSELNKRYRTMTALEYENWDYLFDSNDKDEQKTCYLEGWTL
ncbi:nucleolar complex protein 4 [[Candida] jaroonii]|uniref:Nucleolar complex protein 4 n=1 Tax=[Candida] jaroonii TaxID=467808 RepID=A0ACA9Y0G1_9ASCO|nr:nucleolar complex protein 4 [[Candida] jaroonii]